MYRFCDHFNRWLKFSCGVSWTIYNQAQEDAGSLGYDELSDRIETKSSDRQRSLASMISAIRRSSAIIWRLGLKTTSSVVLQRQYVSVKYACALLIRYAMTSAGIFKLFIIFAGIKILRKWYMAQISKTPVHQIFRLTSVTQERRLYKISSSHMRATLTANKQLKLKFN